MTLYRFSINSRTPYEQGEPAREPVHAARSAPQPKPFSTAESSRLRERMMDAKLRIHASIIDEVNLATIEKLPTHELRPQVYDLVVKHVNNERLVLNDAELELFVDDILNEMKGLGPIEMLLKDDAINDILINTHSQIYVERGGILELSEARFKDEAHLLRIINKIVSTVGRRVDESQPFCDARLLDGSRVNVAIKPIAIDGPLVSIRKFSKRPYSMDKLVDTGSLSPAMAALLSAAVVGRATIMVSGGTGSGKTTMLNALSSFIHPNERLITIEDAAELQLQQPHVGRLETRPPSIEGKGEIRQRELVKNALRMRPDRIIIGECRGEEAFDMLQAMNTGHDGSMTTIHANTTRDALMRLEQMVGMASFPMTTQSIRTQIASAIRLVVQLSRLSDGKRRVVSIAEITGMEEDVIQMQEIFRFHRTATLEDGTIQGEYLPTGLRPKFLSSLAAGGINLPSSYFDPGRAH
jgi:pilus assembly protein CpaF